MTDESDLEISKSPVFRKLKLETVRRNLTVKEVNFLTPHMLRVTLEGEELTGFTSPAPDDHIIIFFPTEAGEPERREFTPRRFDAEAGTLSIDFALHEGGLGSTWARQAKPGDPIRIGGPRGSTIVSGLSLWWLLIGDETAVPAIGRRLEELQSGTQVTALITVTDAAEEQAFETQAQLVTRWVHRPVAVAADPAPVMKILAELKLPEGPGIIWIATEGEVARAVRTYCLNTLGHPAEWITAKAYWVQAQ